MTWLAGIFGALVVVTATYDKPPWSGSEIAVAGIGAAIIVVALLAHTRR